MSAIGGPLAGKCRVIEESKLPAAIAPDALCSEIERAIAMNAPSVRHSVEIRVLSRSRLAATLTVEGRMLPVQNFAVMDANLGEASVKRFAASLAALVAEAAKP